MPSEPTDRVYLQLWPDWSPSQASALARFPAILKVAEGGSVAATATLEVRLRDAGGDVVATEATTLAEPIDGPAWRPLPGGLVAIDGAVRSAEAALDGAVSARASRDDAARSVLLVPVGCDLGLPGEPHLWWCYRNQGEAPVAVADVQRTMLLQVDERALRPPPAPYNGPARLPPGRALAGWWSLDDLASVDRRVPHRFALRVGGERSEPFRFAW